VSGQRQAPAALYPPEKDPVPIVQEAGWAQGRSGQVRKISPTPGFDPRTVKPVASSYTDYTTRPLIARGCKITSSPGCVMVKIKYEIVETQVLK
jgi:hypothetical protein